MREYLDKNELEEHIEANICAWCANYHKGDFCSKCTICKVSQVFSTIALSTPYHFPDDAEITIDPNR